MAGWGGIAERAAGAVRRAEAARDVVLLAVVVGGAGLRFWGLGGQSLWYDEWLTTEATSGGLTDLLRHVANREGIPPPYFLLLWGWVRVFGDGEVALRAVSALAGVATIPVAYAVVRELGPGRRAARVAAVLVAVNPMLVWYSQEARPYSLLALAGAVSLLAFARVWRRGRRVDWVVWAAVAAITVAVHYFAAFVVLAQAIVLLALSPGPAGHGRAISARPSGTAGPPGATPDRSSPDGRPWRPVALGLVPSGVVLLLLAPVALEQHSHEANRLWISDFPLSTRLADAARSAVVGPSPPTTWLWTVAALAVLLATALLLLPTGDRGGTSASLPLARQTEPSGRATAPLARPTEPEGRAVAPPVRPTEPGGGAAGLLVVQGEPGGRAVGLVVAAVGALAVALSLGATAAGVDVVLGRYLIASLVPLAIAVAAGLTAGTTGDPARRTRSTGTGEIDVPRGTGSGGDPAGHPADEAGPGGHPAEADQPGWAGPGDERGGAAEGGTGRGGERGGAMEPGTGRRSGVVWVTGAAGMAGLAVLCVVSLVAVVAVARDPDLQRAEWRHVADVVESGSAGGGARVLVVNLHGGMAQPLLHYLDGSRRLDGDATVRVEAVDVLVSTGTDRPCNLLVGRGCGLIFLGTPPPEPLARQLDLVEQVELDQFRIDRYRAAAPVTVARDDLLSPADRSQALIVVP